MHGAEQSGGSYQPAIRLYNISDHLVRNRLALRESARHTRQFRELPDEECLYSYWLWEADEDGKARISPDRAASRLAIRATVLYSPTPENRYVGIGEADYYAEYPGGNGFTIRLDAESFAADEAVSAMYRAFNQYLLEHPNIHRFATRNRIENSRRIDRVSSLFEEIEDGLADGAKGAAVRELYDEPARASITL